jgi:hypothetical protein
VQCAHLSICNNSGISNVSGFVGTTKLINSTFNVCKVDGNSSSGGAVKGMTFDDADHVVCKECSASGNITSAGTSSVHGIEFVALQNVEMKCMQTSNNVSFGSHVYGLSMANGKAVTIDGLSSNFNQSDSDSIAYGLRATGSLTGSQLLHVSCDSNLGGISVYGIDIENAQSVTCTALSAVSNKAAENARGLYMHTGNIISCKQGNFSGNTVTVSGISSENSLQTVELSKHAPSHLSTGAYGMNCSNLNGLLCSDIEASRNSGFRCSGVVAHGITESVFKNCITSYQRATGNYFIDTPFSGVDMTVIPVQANQVSTIFGGISDTTLVNAKDAMTTMLLSVMALKDLQDSCEINPENTVQYGYLKSLVSTQLLLRAIIAQFRRFGTAIGLHLHNCTNCHVYDHTAHGNVSEKDSGIGLAMTGTSVGHICKQGSFSGNEGWTDSKRQSDVDKTIDISEVLPFWQALGMKMLTADNVDTTTNIVGSITQSHLSWLPATRSAPYTHIGRLTVSFNTDTGPFYELVHPVGGIGAGVIVGDAAENIKIKDVIASNNRSGAGQAYGILQDVTTSCVVQDSQMYQMFANTLGYAYGLAEFNFQSNSIHSGNVLFGNAIENMLNANYLVPYDPTNCAQLSFQVKKIYNGDFSQMANILPYDNIEIEFIGKRSADRNLPDNVKEDWLSTYTS